METTPRTLSLQGRDRIPPRAWTGKAGIRHISRQRYDSPRHGDLSTAWCPQVNRSVPLGLVNLSFRSEAVTFVLNFCSAACRGSEFHQCMGKPQATGVLHQSPHHTCCHCCSCSPQTPAHTNTRVGREPSWKGPEGLSTCLAHHDPSLACCPEPQATDYLPAAPSVSIPPSHSSFHFPEFSL